MTTTKISNQVLDSWADDANGPVALCLTQRWLPVEGKDAVLFPPTYADIGYNIDVLADGTKVATIDSVGSQANRIEPIFKAAPSAREANPLADLVPQIDIEYGEGRTISLLEAGHRLGDVLVRCTELAEQAKAAFQRFLDQGDASGIATLSPTSLVFGVWDSRDTSAKLPRILRSEMRAKDVEVLKRSAQYHPALDYEELGVFKPEERKKSKDALSERGFLDVPAVGSHGGIIAKGPIERSLTLNLIALRRLDGEKGDKLRRYILGLALVAATAPLDGFLRQGCLLTPDPDHPSNWEAVSRDHGAAVEYAKSTASAFGKGPDRHVKFEPKRAKADVDLAKKSKKDKE
jgi:CRISPR-associated protein Csb1